MEFDLTGLANETMKVKRNFEKSQVISAIVDLVTALYARTEFPAGNQLMLDVIACIYYSAFASAPCSES